MCCAWAVVDEGREVLAHRRGGGETAGGFFAGAMGGFSSPRLFLGDPAGLLACGFLRVFLGLCSHAILLGALGQFSGQERADWLLQKVPTGSFLPEAPEEALSGSPSFRLQQCPQASGQKQAGSAAFWAGGRPTPSSALKTRSPANRGSDLP